MVPRPRAVVGKNPRRGLLQSAEASNYVATGCLWEQKEASEGCCHSPTEKDIIPFLLPITPDLQANQLLSRSSCVHPLIKPALDPMATRK